MSEEFSHQLLRVVVAKLCQPLGWHGMHVSAGDVLTDVMKHYILTLAKTTSAYSALGNRTEPSLSDLGQTFQALDVELKDIAEYCREVDSLPTKPVPLYPLPRSSGHVSHAPSSEAPRRHRMVVSGGSSCSSEERASSEEGEVIPPYLPPLPSQKEPEKDDDAESGIHESSDKEDHSESTHDPARLNSDPTIGLPKRFRSERFSSDFSEEDAGSRRNSISEGVAPAIIRSPANIESVKPHHTATASSASVASSNDQSKQPLQISDNKPTTIEDNDDNQVAISSTAQKPPNVFETAFLTKLSETKLSEPPPPSTPPPPPPKSPLLVKKPKLPPLRLISTSSDPTFSPLYQSQQQHPPLSPLQRSPSLPPGARPSRQLAGLPILSPLNTPPNRPVKPVFHHSAQQIGPAPLVSGGGGGMSGKWKEVASKSPTETTAPVSPIRPHLPVTLSSDVISSPIRTQSSVSMTTPLHASFTAAVGHMTTPPSHMTLASSHMTAIPSHQATLLPVTSLTQTPETANQEDSHTPTYPAELEGVKSSESLSPVEENPSAITHSSPPEKQLYSVPGSPVKAALKGVQVTLRRTPSFHATPLSPSLSASPEKPFEADPLSSSSSSPSSSSSSSSSSSGGSPSPAPSPSKATPTTNRGQSSTRDGSLGAVLLSNDDDDGTADMSRAESALVASSSAAAVEEEDDGSLAQVLVPRLLSSEGCEALSVTPSPPHSIPSPPHTPTDQSSDDEEDQQQEQEVGGAKDPTEEEGGKTKTNFNRDRSSLSPTSSLSEDSVSFQLTLPQMTRRLSDAVKSDHDVISGRDDVIIPEGLDIELSSDGSDESEEESESDTEELESDLKPPMQVILKTDEDVPISHHVSISHVPIPRNPIPDVPVPASLVIRFNRSSVPSLKRQHRESSRFKTKAEMKADSASQSTTTLAPGLVVSTGPVLPVTQAPPPSPVYLSNPPTPSSTPSPPPPTPPPPHHPHSITPSQAPVEGARDLTKAFVISINRRLLRFSRHGVSMTPTQEPKTPLGAERVKLLLARVGNNSSPVATPTNPRKRELDLSEIVFSSAPKRPKQEQQVPSEKYSSSSSSSDEDSDSMSPSPSPPPPSLASHPHTLTASHPPQSPSPSSPSTPSSSSGGGGGGGLKLKISKALLQSARSKKKEPFGSAAVSKATRKKQDPKPRGVGGGKKRKRGARKSSAVAPPTLSPPPPPPPRLMVTSSDPVVVQRRRTVLPSGGGGGSGGGVRVGRGGRGGGGGGGQRGRSREGRSRGGGSGGGGGAGLIVQSSAQQTIPATGSFSISPQLPPVPPVPTSSYICPECDCHDDGSLMIGCDGCDSWIHGRCVGISQAPPDTEKWFCRNCQRRQKKSKRKR